MCVYTYLCMRVCVCARVSAVHQEMFAINNFALLAVQTDL